MRIRAGFLLAITVLVASSVFAQRSTLERDGQSTAAIRPRANQGRIPPAPPRRSDPEAARESEHLSTGHVNDTPHVNNDVHIGAYVHAMYMGI